MPADLFAGPARAEATGYGPEVVSSAQAGCRREHVGQEMVTLPLADSNRATRILAWLMEVDMLGGAGIVA